MNCKEAARLLSDRFCRELTADVEASLDEHLENCSACRQTANVTASLWSQLDEIEVDVPHDRMRARFHAALAAYEERTRNTGLEGFWTYLWPQRPAFQLGIAASLLVVGLLVGRLLPISDPTNETPTGSDEIGAVSLALLEHPSASERLRGVAWAQRAQLSDRVVAALIAAVRNDPSVNVRLAAVEALSGGLDRPRVGEGLTNALYEQQSPLMQVALAEVLLAGGVDGSTAALRRMIEQPDLDPIVREYLETVLMESAGGPENGTVF